MPYLQDLVNAATEAKIQAAYANERADRLKAAAIGAAERARTSGIPVRELSSDQRLGSLRLDADGLPAEPKVTKPDETASWLAEHAPQLLEASIRVPVGKLEEVLRLLEFADLAGPEVSAHVTFRDPAEASAWVLEHCIVQADPDVPRAWNILHRDADGHTTPVPGVIGVKPVPYWVIRTDDTHRAAAIATAREEVDGLVAQLREQDAEDAGEGRTAAARSALEGAGFDYPAVLAELAAIDADRADLRDEAAELEAGEEERLSPVLDAYTAADRSIPEDVPEGEVTPLMPRPVLVARAREMGLPIGGNKAELVSRINTATRKA